LTRLSLLGDFRACEDVEQQQSANTANAIQSRGLVVQVAAALV